MAGFGGLAYGLSAAYPGMLQAQADQDVHALNALKELAERQQLQQQAQLFPLRMAQAKQTLAAGGRRAAGASDDAAMMRDFLTELSRNSPIASEVPGGYAMPQPPGTQSTPTQITPPAGLQGTGFGQLAGAPLPAGFAAPAPAPPMRPSMAPPPGLAGTGFGDIIQASVPSPSVPPPSGAPDAMPARMPPSAGPGPLPQTSPGPVASAAGMNDRDRVLAALTATVRAHPNASGKAIEALFREAKRLQPSGRAAKTEVSDTIAKDVADSIVNGEQSPDLKGLYRHGAAVRAELHKQGFDLAKAQQEWQRASRAISSLQSPQMTRFVGLGQSVVSTIDELKSLADQMQQPGMRLFNRASLWEAMNLEGNTPRGQLATRYITALNTLKEEFANLASGGYAPTESVWTLANQQLQSDFGVEQMGASLQEIQRLINYRLQAVPNIKTLGPLAPSRYVPSTTPGAAPGPAPAPAPAPAPTSTRTAIGPGGVRLTLSPDGKTWLGPDGNPWQTR